MLLLIPKGKTYIFNKLMEKRPYLILECVQIVCTDNMYKMKTIDLKNVIMVLNNDVKMINQVLPFYIYMGQDMMKGTLWSR